MFRQINTYRNLQVRRTIVNESANICHLVVVVWTTRNYCGKCFLKSRHREISCSRTAKWNRKPLIAILITEMHTFHWATVCVFNGNELKAWRRVENLTMLINTNIIPIQTYLCLLKLLLRLYPLSKRTRSVKHYCCILHEYTKISD